jgi:hypothetical protein
MSFAQSRCTVLGDVHQLPSDWLSGAFDFQIEATDGMGGGGRWGAAGYQNEGPWKSQMHRPLCDNASFPRSWELASSLKFKHLEEKAQNYDDLRAVACDRNHTGRDAS